MTVTDRAHFSSRCTSGENLLAPRVPSCRSWESTTAFDDTLQLHRPPRWDNALCSHALASAASQADAVGWRPLSATPSVVLHGERPVLHGSVR